VPKIERKLQLANINTYRDYSWITEVVKAILLITKLSSKDFIISAGRKISGKEILAAAYKLNKLDFKKYYSVNQKFYRNNEDKILMGSIKNSSYLKKNFNFRFKIFGNSLIKKMYKSL
jgi:GDPmannose 4,6-dehydratase